jgi:MYXO-CTERM domain-containing protein
MNCRNDARLVQFRNYLLGFLCACGLSRPALGQLHFTSSGNGVTINKGFNSPLLLGFDVTGVNGDVKDISVSLNLSHTYLGDLDVILSDPAGHEFTLFSRVGNSNASCNIDGLFVFSDGASGNLWGSAAGLSTSDTLTGGSFRTSLAGVAPTDPRFPRAPALTTFANDSGFIGLAPDAANGRWQLRITDFDGDDEGTIGNATLSIAVTPEPGMTGLMAMATLTAWRRRRKC